MKNEELELIIEWNKYLKELESNLNEKRSKNKEIYVELKKNREVVKEEENEEAL